MIDTHAHLSVSAFDADRDAVVARALEANRHVVEIAIAPDTARKAVALAEANERISASVGIHPHEAGRQTIDDLEPLMPLYDNPVVVAVGETGLDFYRDYAPHDRQETLFRRQIGVARERGLPLVLHSRGAEREVIDILREEKAQAIGGVLHCYGGPMELIPEILDLGFYIGFGGSVTRSKGRYRKMLKDVPVESVLLETDCPYLAPAPETSRRNEPAFLAEVIPLMASFMGIEAAVLDEASDRNAAALFGSRLTRA